MRYNDIDILVAFSGAVKDGDEEYTEAKLNVRKDGSHISENQTKAEFHDNFNVMIVAEKYQTGFDEPLLHTMIVDKKLKGVKAVQTLSRLNRTCNGKYDTFILDFINTKEDIIEAFQPFYQETYLEHEVNVDLIYQVQNSLRGFAIYSDTEISAFCKEYFQTKGQNERAMGRMTSILKPIADRYNAKTIDERYNFRRDIRKFVKWYGYISQVVRMFDKELHQEFIFCSYLIKLLPAEKVEMIDIESKLKLEFYKLQKTFEGAITLEEKKGSYAGGDSVSGKGENKKTPLDEIIEKINEKYKGLFSDADRVLIISLQDKLMKDDKLKKIVKTTEPKIFNDIFPKIFNNVAEESYKQSQEAYTSLFQDTTKYNTIMQVLADYVYSKMRK